jgi:acetylornithine deacetylase/succinyl-diaminopimelate desuccinylase-like protein
VRPSRKPVRQRGQPVYDAGRHDSRFLRRKGIPAYGFNPVILDREELATVHADNEKLSLDNLTLGMQVMREIVEKCCV